VRKNDLSVRKWQLSLGNRCKRCGKSHAIGTPEEDSLEATSENRHGGCGRDMLRQTVPSTGSCNREGLIIDGVQLCMMDIQWQWGSRSKASQGLKISRAVSETPSQSNGMSLATWDHTACHPTQVKHPALSTPARQVGIWLTYHGGIEGWVDIDDRLHNEMIYPPIQRRDCVSVRKYGCLQCCC